VISHTRRTVTVHVDVAPELPAAILSEADTLDSGGVLTGFAPPLHDLFAELDRQG
jgi:hypothetical protein